MGKVAVPLLVLLTGCQSTGGSYCQISNVIRPEVRDVEVISDSLAVQLTAHNEKMERLCGAKP